MTETCPSCCRFLDVHDLCPHLNPVCPICCGTDHPDAHWTDWNRP